MEVVVGVPESVVDHGVHQLAVVEPVAGAGLPEDVGGPGHVLHAAGHYDLVLPGLDRVGGDAYGLEARPAHLVDRHGAGLVGYSRLDGRLPGGVLAQAGPEDVAHDDLLDLRGVNLGPADRLGDDRAPELLGRGLRE